MTTPGRGSVRVFYARCSCPNGLTADAEFQKFNGDRGFPFDVPKGKLV
jgi:hypothetical protein